MYTNRISTWVIVGVFFWGIPTGILLSFMLAFIKPHTFIEMQPFHQEIFLQNLMIFGPLFAFLGVLVGWIIYLWAKKHCA